ncbi:succinyl-diaminopimelate desuccinylase [Buchnera aphidicola (Ceratoglyphina bambusae)]|uniref:succinyl-diaminopimelate desuccinylase n=1 Tax=Buchnera aphidicola TaxID=9 RepID=UPI0031B7F146
MICPILKLAKKLISIPSISPNDLGCQKIICNRLIKIGFSIKYFNIKDTKNIWAEIGNNNGKTINFLGHTDVVPPGEISKWKFYPFNPTVYKNNLFGRGVADMKGAIAAFITAIERFLLKYSNQYKGKITILLTSDEEGSGKYGIKEVVKNLINEKIKINYCIVGEPTSKKFLADTIKNGRRGSLNVEIHIFGKGGHIAYPKFSENIIHKTCFFINDLIKFNWKENIKHYDERTCVQISKIRSKDVVENSHSESLYIRINFRFSYKNNVEKIKLCVQNLLKLHNIKYKIFWRLSGSPFITKNGLLLDAVKKSIFLFNKMHPNISTSGGTSDGRFISSMKSEIIELGLLNSNIHKVNENVKISDLKKLSLIYENIIKILFLNKD